MWLCGAVGGGVGGGGWRARGVVQGCEILVKEYRLHWFGELWHRAGHVRGFVGFNGSPDFEFEISNSKSDHLTLNLNFQIQSHMI